MSDKSRALLTILAFFFGVFGAHRFYVGKIGSGLAMLVTIGGFGIWSFIDFLLAAFGEFKDSNGLKISKW
jgi:TM2 domain-containing membrane protein YozV